MTTRSSWVFPFSNPFKWALDEQKKVDEEKRQEDLENASVVDLSNPSPDRIEIDESKGKEEEYLPSRVIISDEPDEIIEVKQETSSWSQWIREWTEPMMPIDGKDINPFSAPVTEEAKKTRRAITKEINEIRKKKLRPEMVSRTKASPFSLPDSTQEEPTVKQSKDPILCKKRKKTNEELEKFNRAITAYSLFFLLHEYAAGEQLPIDEEGNRTTYQKMVRRALEPKEGEESLSLWQVYRESLGKNLSLFSFLKAFLFYHVFFTFFKFIPTLIEALTKSALDHSRKSLIKSETLAFLSSRMLDYADTYLHIIDGARIEFERDDHRSGSLDDYLQRALERSYTREFEDLVKEDSSRAVELFFPETISFCSLGENSSFTLAREIGGAFSSLVNYFANALIKKILEKSIIPSVFRSTITNAIDISPEKSYIFTRGIYQVATKKVAAIRENLEEPQPIKETPSIKIAGIAGIEKLADVSNILVKVLDTSPNQEKDISKELEIGIAKAGKIALEMLHDKKVMEDLFASLFGSLYSSLTSEETFQDLKKDHDLWQDALNIESDELFTTLIDQAIKEKISPQSKSLEEQTKNILSNIKTESGDIFSQIKQLTPTIERIASSINDPKNALTISKQLEETLIFSKKIMTSIKDSIDSSLNDPGQMQELSTELQKLLPMIKRPPPLLNNQQEFEALHLNFSLLTEAICSSNSDPNIMQKLLPLMQQIVALIDKAKEDQNTPLEHGFTAIEIFCNLMQKLNQRLDLKQIIEKNPEMSPAQRESFDRMLQPIRSHMLELTRFMSQLNKDQNCHYLCLKTEHATKQLFIGWDQTRNQLREQKTEHLVETFTPTLKALEDTIELYKKLKIPLRWEDEDLKKSHENLSKLLETIQEETRVINQLRSLIESDSSPSLVARLVYLQQYPDKPLPYFDAKALKRQILGILTDSNLNQPPFISMIDQMQTYTPPNLRKDWSLFEAFILRQVGEDQEDLRELLKEALGQWKNLPRGRGVFDLNSWREQAKELSQKSAPSDRENLRALLYQTESFLTKNSIIPVYWNRFCQQVRLQIDHRTGQRDEALSSYEQNPFIHDFVEEQLGYLYPLQKETHQSIQTNLQDIQAKLEMLSKMTSQLKLEKSYSPTQVITGMSLATGVAIGTVSALMAPPMLASIAVTAIGAAASHFYDPKHPWPMSAVKGAAVGAALGLTGPAAPLLAGGAIGYYAGQRATQTATDYGREKLLGRVTTMRQNLFTLIPKIRKTVVYAALEGFSKTGQAF